MFSNLLLILTLSLLSHVHSMPNENIIISETALILEPQSALPVNIKYAANAIKESDFRVGGAPLLISGATVSSPLKQSSIQLLNGVQMSFSTAATNISVAFTLKKMLLEFKSAKKIELSSFNSESKSQSISIRDGSVSYTLTSFDNSPLWKRSILLQQIFVRSQPQLAAHQVYHGFQDNIHLYVMAIPRSKTDHTCMLLAFRDAISLPKHDLKGSLVMPASQAPPMLPSLPPATKEAFLNAGHAAADATEKLLSKAVSGGSKAVDLFKTKDGNVHPATLYGIAAVVVIGGTVLSLRSIATHK
jgi:hypothetical protein